MRKLRYLRVSYRNLERNFYESAHNNGVEKYNEQSRKLSSQQWILKKAERLIYHHCVVIMSDRPSNLLKHFLLVTLPYMNDTISISIYTKNYKAVYTYHQVFCCPESVNTKRENPMVYGVNFTQCFCTGIVRVGYSPPFFYYELLVIPLPKVPSCQNRCMELVVMYP